MTKIKMMCYNKVGDRVKELSEIIENCNNIVFFGGAGVSTESGIPDFRSDTGLFKKYPYRAEVILSHSFYKKHPNEFYNFYLKEMIHLNALPNQCHKALAKLEEMGKLKAIITQNIDGLHQMAGSKNVYELHGSIHRNYCEKCHKFYSLEDIIKTHICTCGGNIKPDVVLYEEPLDNDIFEGAIEKIKQADTLIIGGTSLAVYPANTLLYYFHGKNLIIINKEANPMDKKANLVIHDTLGHAFSFLNKK